MRILKESFNAGEFTPRLYSRYELSKYKNGCKTLTNLVPTPHGPVVRRPGTEYIAAVKTAGRYTRLIPFEFSEADSYVLEFGGYYIRFFHNGAQVQGVDAATRLLLHFEGVNWSQTFLDQGATVHEATVAGNTMIYHSYYKFGQSGGKFDGTGDYITFPDHADWNFGAAAFTIDCWVSAVGTGSGTYTILHQETDATHYHKLYLVISGIVQTLHFYVKNGATTLDLSYVTSSINPDSFTRSGWNHVAVIRGWGGAVNSWALCVGGVVVDTATDVLVMQDLTGDLYIGSDGTYAWKGYMDEFRISKGVARWTTAFVPPTSPYPFGDDSGTTYEIVTNFQPSDLPYLSFVQSADVMYIVHENRAVQALTRTATASWAIANVSFTTAPAAWVSPSYPRTVAFYEDRLVFGGTPNDPDTVWTSDVGDYAVFTGDAEDDSAVTLTLAARKINDIQWIASSRRLIIGTRGEEWWCSGSSDTEPMTPTSQVAKRDSSWGSERIMPVDIGETVFYVQRGGKAVREMIYDYSSDKYKSTDMNILAEHLTRDYKITAMAYQQNPYQILWCVRLDGTLLALTYLKEHDVIGWSTHTSSDGEFESVCTIPGQTEDEVWFVVKRVVDGSTVRYVERLKPFNYGSDLEDACFVDSGLSYDGTAATTISGLDHLEGESVAVLADGVVVTGKTVSSGAITLSTAASKVHVGLAYTPEFETLEAVAQNNDGSLQGVIKRITNVSFSLINSMGGVFGPDSSTTDPIPYDDETALFTGWTRDLSFDEGFDNTSTVYIKCDEPLPMEIAAILIDLEE